MKKILAVILTLCTGLTLLSGCVGHPDNLSNEEVLKQVQAQMKEEMNKIGFEIDLNDYEFKVELHQSLGSSGEVTMKDKRYNYKPLKIYNGSFISIEKDNVCSDPLAFIYSDYVQYIDEISSESNKVIQDYLLKQQIKYRVDTIGGTTFTGKPIRAYTLEIVNGKVVLDKTAPNSELFLWEGKAPTLDEYFGYFRNKSTENFDYSAFDLANSKGVVYCYELLSKDETKQEDIAKLQETLQGLVQNKRFFVGVVQGRGI